MHRPLSRMASILTLTALLCAPVESKLKPGHIPRGKYETLDPNVINDTQLNQPISPNSKGSSPRGSGETEASLPQSWRDGPKMLYIQSQKCFIWAPIAAERLGRPLIGLMCLAQPLGSGLTRVCGQRHWGTGATRAGSGWRWL